MQTHSQPIRWGILGTGNIANQFAEAIVELPDAELYAVGSRHQERAEAFGRRWDGVQAYAGYENLLNDHEVDVVYIATPNHRHQDDCLACFDAGKPVLCEKPLAINALQVETIIAAARKQRLFCMEAMWMRFIPLVQKLKTLLDEGVVGEVCYLSANFGVRAPRSPKGRHFNPDLGGGALLDLGVYPISLAYYLLGEPQDISSQGVIGPTGVDEQMSAIFRYSGGALANLSASLQTVTTSDAVIAGSEGEIQVHAPFYCPSFMTLRKHAEPQGSAQPLRGRRSRFRSLPFVGAVLKRPGRALKDWLRKQRYSIPYRGNGYGHEAEAVMRCLRSDRLECPDMSLDESLSIMKTIDRIRQSWVPANSQETIAL